MNTPTNVKDQENKKNHRRKESCDQLPPLMKGVTIYPFEDMDFEEFDEDIMMQIDDANADADSLQDKEVLDFKDDLEMLIDVPVDEIDTEKTAQFLYRPDDIVVDAMEDEVEEVG